MNSKLLFGAVAVTAVATAQANGVNGPQGVKFLNERLTVSPYVSLSYTYDSNVDSGKHGKSGSQWQVNPGMKFDYTGDNWGIDAALLYTYHAYNRYTHSLNESSYGERLSFNWNNAKAGEKGWTIRFTENFRQIAQDDDMSNHDGRGIGRDRKQLQAQLEIDRRLNEHWHGGFEGDYYLLDYDNNVNKYAPLYGWTRVNMGGVIGYTASRWADILLSGSYMSYTQDNDRNRERNRTLDARGRHVASSSKGVSVMAGVGTHATEKLSYKAQAGWSQFKYGNGVAKNNGFIYRVSANWQVDAENTMRVMLLGSSHYQPSEREYGTAIKVYTLSTGLSKSLVRNRLTASADLAYRKETHEYTSYASDDYDEDIWTVRFGLDYRLNRLFSIFGRIEYQTEETEGGAARGHEYDYDRWRGTVGVRLSY